MKLLENGIELNPIINVWVQSEVKFLGKFTHPNLVKLLGYCWEDKQFLLVYEYMPKGSLENHLFRGKKPSFFFIKLKKKRNLKDMFV